MALMRRLRQKTAAPGPRPKAQSCPQQPARKPKAQRSRARASGATARSAAIKEGVAPKARKPFALFMMEHGQLRKGASREAFQQEMKRLAQEWKSLPASSRQKFKDMSSQEEARQRAALSEHGIFARRAWAGPKGGSAAQPDPEKVSAPLLQAIGPFKVMSKPDMSVQLGCGSYGKVCLCTSVHGGKHAVKLFTSKHGKEDADRELQVFQQLQKLPAEDARWFPALRNFDTKGDPFPWIALQFCGASLADVLRSGPLRGFALWSAAAQLRKGLQTLHSLKILHLDVKPGNILYSEGTDELKITDFGLAERWGALAGDSSTANFREYATEPYRPPELWHASDSQLPRSLSPAVDQWSFGCTVFELCNGSMLMAQLDQRQGYDHTVSQWCKHWGFISKEAVMSGELRGGCSMSQRLRARARRGGEWCWKVVRQTCSPIPSQRQWPALPALTL